MKWILEVPHHLLGGTDGREEDVTARDTNGSDDLSRP
jgi:hypothetical protein